jgi:hypothetical protein
MKFYISSAYLNTREIVEIARAADELGYDGIGIPDHVVNLETLSTPYPYTKDGQRRWQPFTEWPDPWVLVGEPIFEQSEQALRGNPTDVTLMRELIGGTTVDWRDGMRRMAAKFNPDPVGS